MAPREAKDSRQLRARYAEFAAGVAANMETLQYWAQGLGQWEMADTLRVFSVSQYYERDLLNLVHTLQFEDTPSSRSITIALATSDIITSSLLPALGTIFRRPDDVLMSQEHRRQLLLTLQAFVLVTQPWTGVTGTLSQIKATDALRRIKSSLCVLPFWLDLATFLIQDVDVVLDNGGADACQAALRVRESPVTKDQSQSASLLVSSIVLLRNLLCIPDPPPETREPPMQASLVHILSASGMLDLLVYLVSRTEDLGASCLPPLAGALCVLLAGADQHARLEAEERERSARNAQKLSSPVVPKKQPHLAHSPASPSLLERRTGRALPASEARQTELKLDTFPLSDSQCFMAKAVSAYDMGNTLGIALDPWAQKRKKAGHTAPPSLLLRPNSSLTSVGRQLAEFALTLTHVGLGTLLKELFILDNRTERDLIPIMQMAAAGCDALTSLYRHRISAATKVLRFFSQKREFTQREREMYSRAMQQVEAEMDHLDPQHTFLYDPALSDVVAPLLSDWVLARDWASSELIALWVLAVARLASTASAAETLWAKARDIIGSSENRAHVDPAKAQSGPPPICVGGGELQTLRLGVIQLGLYSVWAPLRSMVEAWRPRGYSCSAALAAAAAVSQLAAVMRPLCQHGLAIGRSHEADNMVVNENELAQMRYEEEDDLFGPDPNIVASQSESAPDEVDVNILTRAEEESDEPAPAAEAAESETESGPGSSQSDVIQEELEDGSGSEEESSDEDEHQPEVEEARAGARLPPVSSIRFDVRMGDEAIPLVFDEHFLQVIDRMGFVDVLVQLIAILCRGTARLSPAAELETLSSVCQLLYALLAARYGSRLLLQRSIVVLSVSAVSLPETSPLRRPMFTLLAAIGQRLLTVEATMPATHRWLCFTLVGDRGAAKPLRDVMRDQEDRMLSIARERRAEAEDRALRERAIDGPHQDEAVNVIEEFLALVPDETAEAIERSLPVPPLLEVTDDEMARCRALLPSFIEEIDVRRYLWARGLLVCTSPPRPDVSLTDRMLRGGLASKAAYENTQIDYWTAEETQELRAAWREARTAGDAESLSDRQVALKLSIGLHDGPSCLRRLLKLELAHVPRTWDGGEDEALEELYRRVDAARAAGHTDAEIRRAGVISYCEGILGRSGSLVWSHIRTLVDYTRVPWRDLTHRTRTGVERDAELATASQLLFDDDEDADWTSMIGNLQSYAPEVRQMAQAMTFDDEPEGPDEPEEPAPPAGSARPANSLTSAFSDLLTGI